MAHGIALDAAEQERIRSSTDLAELDRWLERALGASSAGELFGPP